MNLNKTQGHRMSINKIKNQSEIKQIISQLREKNPEIKIVTTNGAFDIIHSGHVASLEKAKSLGDVLIVGLNSDKSVRGYKSSLRPIIPQEERAKLLAALEAVDYVVIFEELDPRKLLEIIKPNVHVKSKLGFKGIEREVIESAGGRIELLEDLPGMSTTLIMEKIKKIITQEEEGETGG